MIIKKTQLFHSLHRTPYDNHLTTLFNPARLNLSVITVYQFLQKM